MWGGAKARQKESPETFMALGSQRLNQTVVIGRQYYSQRVLLHLRSTWQR